MSEQTLIAIHNPMVAYEFSQLCDLDCSECYSKNVDATGSYTKAGTGFYVFVKCRDCGEITECGDGEFLTNVATFKNDEFHPLELKRYSVRYTPFHNEEEGCGDERVVGIMFAENDQQAGELVRRTQPIPKEAKQEYDEEGKLTYFTIEKGEKQAWWCVEREYHEN